MHSPFRKWYWWLTAGLLLAAAVVFFCLRPQAKDTAADNGDTTSDTQPQAEYMLGLRIDTLQLEDGRIKDGWSLSLLLGRYGVPARVIDQVVKTAKPVFDVRRIQSGHDYIAMRTLDSLPRLRYFLYKESRTDYVIFDFADSLQVYRAQKEVLM